MYVYLLTIDEACRLLFECKCYIFIAYYSYFSLFIYLYSSIIFSLLNIFYHLICFVDDVSLSNVIEVFLFFFTQFVSLFFQFQF
jgi:hypothetical protein